MTQQRTVRIEKFLGLNNKWPRNTLSVQERDVIETYLQEAVNVDIIRDAKFARRAGATQLDAQECHSLWADPFGQHAFIVFSGVLSKLAEDYTGTALTQVGERQVVYTRANHEIYMSDDESIWAYDLDTDLFEVLTAVGTYERDRFKLDMSEEAPYYSAPPPGYALAFFGGRLLVANEYGLWFSEFGFPRRFNEEDSFIPFDDITVLGVVDDGLFLGYGDCVYFMSGTNIKKQQFRLVTGSRAVKGTLIQTDAKHFRMDGASGPAVIWESEEGKILGLNGGRVEKLTEDRVSYATSTFGASFMREQNGETHHISTFPDRGMEANNLRTTDIAIAEVRRNGILIAE